MLPDGWESTTFDELADFKNGLNFSSNDKGHKIKVLGVGDFQKRSNIDQVDNISSVFLEKKVAPSYMLKEGDLVFVRSNGNKALVGRCLHIGQCNEDISFSGFTIRARIKEKNKVLPSFVSLLMQNGLLHFLLQKEGRGTNISNLNQGILSKLVIPYPCTSEQREIISVVNAWDIANDKVENIIKQKQKQKKALMQRLLTGKQRFPEFEGQEWQEVEIEKLLKVVKRPVQWSDSDQYNLLSVRRRSGGAFPRSSLLGKDILTKNMSTALAGDFLISKMQVVHGAMALTPAKYSGMHISGSYISLVAKDPDNFDIRFFDWLSRCPEMYHKAYRSSYGVHIEKMTFNLKLFLKERIRFPVDKKEQRKIAMVLHEADKEIDLLTQKLEAYQEQKKGLMQQLLTGKKRVKLDRKEAA